MAMEGNTTCAVHGCIMPISGPNNLCDEHRLPGMVVRVKNSTMVVSAWSANHGDEVGIILLNDFALGNLFGGRKGFEARLREQGFKNIRNLATLEEVESAKRPTEGTKVGGWGGPWRGKYRWEKSLRARARSTG
jgi:hypothetical protein